MNSATLPDRERVRLAALVGSIVRFKARNIAAAKWEHAFLRTLHLNRDGDWATLKYKSGEWTGDPSCWIIRPRKPRRKVRHRPGRMYCDNCDGCGWYEGGATLQTKCEVCKGKGIVRIKS